MVEEDVVVITLKSLPRSYKHFIDTLNISSTSVDLKFPDLCNKLLQQDRWKQQFGSSASSSTEQAFTASASHKYKGKAPSFQQKGQGQGQPQQSSKKKSLQCSYCHIYGHLVKDCRKLIASQQSKQGGSKQKANSAMHPDQKESAFYAFMAQTSSDDVQSSAWYIDSRASRYFTHRRDWFTEYMPFTDSVIFGGGEEYTVVGKGNVQISSGGRDLIFLNVYFVPCMKLNLLSVSQIMQHSPQLDVVFGLHKCSIVDRETRTTVVVGIKDHGLYRLVDSTGS